MSGKKKRMGGRAERHKLRSASMPVNKRPVRPGHCGGRYQPLTGSEIKQIHSAVLETLETIGIADAIPSQINLLTAAGAIVDSEGRLRFPRALVEDTIAAAARNIVLFGQEERHDILELQVPLYI